VKGNRRWKKADRSRMKAKIGERENFMTGERWELLCRYLRKPIGK
jgi:hypothetical protein